MEKDWGGGAYNKTAFLYYYIAVQVLQFAHIPVLGKVLANHAILVNLLYWNSRRNLFILTHQT